jgi:hypothetical protein
VPHPAPRAPVVRELARTGTLERMNGSEEAARDQSAAVPRRRWLRRGLWVLLAAIALAITSQVARDMPVEELKRSYAGGASRFVDG